MRPSYHLPFVSFAHLYGAWPKWGSFSLPFCPIMAHGPSGPAYHCLSAQFAPGPVMARGPSSERALRRQPSYHFPFVSVAHLYGARPERASFSLPFAQYSPLWRTARAGQLIIAFLRNLPPLWRTARPRSERSVGGPVIICLCFICPPLWRAARAGQLFIAFLPNFPPLWRTARPRSERSVGGPVIICLCFICPPLWRAARAGQLFIAFLPNFPPLWRTARAGQLIIAFLRNLPPLWRASRPRSGRSVGGPIIICLLFHLPSFLARSFSLPFCPIFPRYCARPEQASLSFAFVIEGSCSTAQVCRKPCARCYLGECLSARLFPLVSTLFFFIYYLTRLQSQKSKLWSFLAVRVLALSRPEVSASSYKQRTKRERGERRKKNMYIQVRKTARCLDEQSSKLGLFKSHHQ